MRHGESGGISRRAFIGLAAATGAGATLWHLAAEDISPPPGDGWDAGDVAHILPVVSHERFALKVSLRRPQDSAPLLRVGDLRITGEQTDTAGLFFRFDIAGLAPDTDYRLQLFRPGGTALCADWPLRTFPHPDAEVSHFRLLAYTCAGGPEHLYNSRLFHAWLPNAVRQHLFARGLSFRPHAVVANGDHVYWDLKSSAFLGNSWRAKQVAGHFDPTLPVLGTANEQVLKRAIGPQIADLYGVRFRSTPVFFLQDDHDYGENDEADDVLRTFPPDAFMLDLARTTQQLYYPELPPGDLPAAFVNARYGLGENFGALRYGKLFEGLLYDCRRFLTNELDPATGHTGSAFLPSAVERWLVQRTATSNARHLAHMPSTPVLWSAGKWGEWYPDFLLEDGSLGTDVPKPYWPEGWLEQHDRLMEALVAREDRTALFVSGDLHATGMGRILANAGTSYAANPVYSILSGAVGTGALGWPSTVRGTVGEPAKAVEAEILQQPLEENGFSLLDFGPGDMRVRQFRWLPSAGVGAIGALEPFFATGVTVPG